MAGLFVEALKDLKSQLDSALMRISELEKHLHMYVVSVPEPLYKNANVSSFDIIVPTVDSENTILPSSLHSKVSICYKYETFLFYMNTHKLNATGTLYQNGTAFSTG